MDATDSGESFDEVATDEVPVEQAEPVQNGRIDLTKTEEWRKAQSASDKRFAEQARELRRVQQQLLEQQAFQQREQASRLEHLDPVEQNKILRDMLEQRTRESERQAQMNSIAQQAEQLLDAAGFDWNDDPRLSAVRAEGINLGKLSFAIAQIAREQRENSYREIDKSKSTSAAATRGVVNKELARAGVPKTSNGSSAIAPRDTSKDEIAKLKAEYKTLSAKRLNFMSPEVRAFDAKLAKADLTLGDLRD